MVKKAGVFLIFVTLVFITVLQPAFAGAGAFTEIKHYDRHVPEGLEYVGCTMAVFNTDYWHYSEGVWLDGMKKERKIYDHEEPFWKNPELYYDRPGMNILAEGPLPEKAVKCIEDGVDMVVSVFPVKRDSINLIKAPEYSLENNCVQISALPVFTVSESLNYKQFVPTLEKYIPIVDEGFGWNVYSMYYRGAHIGALGSTFGNDEDSDNRILFTDLLDNAGRIRGGKTYYVPNDETGVTTRANSSGLNIGDDTFNSAGSVGMWFQYSFKVNFYKYKPGDMEVIEILAPNKVAAGKSTASRISLRNNTQVPYTGKNAALLRFRGNNINVETKVELKPFEETDVLVPWTAPAEAGVINVTATLNPDREIAETDYDNNTADRNVIVTAPAASPQPTASPPPAPSPSPAPTAQPLPDFAVTGFRDTRYTTRTISTSYIKVKYTGAAERRGVLLTFDNGAETIRKNVDFNANDEKEFEFSWLTPQAPGTVSVTAEINADRGVAESDYANNRRSFDARIELPPADLSVTGALPSIYAAGKQVLTIINVKNAGERDFSGSETVEVKLTIPSVGLNATKRVNIDKNSSCAVPFFWTAPPPGRFDITAEVNPARVIDETNYANNAVTISAESAQNPNPPFGCDTPRREWSETRYAGTGTRTVLTPEGEPMTETYPIYVTRNFYAEVSISARLLPDAMKSGYGAECEVTATLSTNYDDRNAVIGLQTVYAYLPTSSYTEAIWLEPVPGAANRWRFPVNPTSVTGARVQYVPVSWPDNMAFRIGFTGRDAMSPDGAMCATTYAQVMIRGSMYEDDYTAPLY